MTKSEFCVISNYTTIAVVETAARAKESALQESRAYSDIVMITCNGVVTGFAVTGNYYRARRA